ncbi:ABC transporter family substrate-binding protein [Curtobacterium albidum]|uniref:ABC transporter family substrate-binding protein n=1 Tax=Curtobacterium citreum TaxID=2036 RepID=A0A850DYV3_9MICO|nr:ABC transporter family substrate-binding protein [Curtobacterium albidum]NUU29380.1 ABC transporter family substrate-binding protein [Curtobacterium albidum]
MRIKSTAVLATAAAAALVLAGCSGGGTAGESSSAVAQSSLKSTGWTTADRSSIKDGGTLTLPIDSAPANFQINNLDSGTVDDQTIAGVYLPGFIQFKENGDWEANPDYAESVKLTKDSPQTVEIKINPKAVWSDGTPITVKDVAANWKALNGTNPAFAPLATNVWEDVDSVTQGSDERDVIMTFKKTNADWASVLTGIYPSWAVDTPDHFNKAWAKGPYAADGTTYVSGGPYIVKSFDANGGVLTFEKNSKWWGDTPKLDTIVFKTVSRDGLAQAYANKELDAINLYGSADNLKTANSRSDSKIERSLGTTWRHVTLNGTSEVFKDKEVRQAFAQSLNRKVLAQAILSPVKSPGDVLNNMVYLPGQKGYEDDASKVYGYSTDSAKKKLEDAGYKIGSNGYASKDGKELDVRFVIPSDNQNSANIAQLVQQQTKLAGFKVTIDTVPTDDFFTKYITTTTRDFDATYFAWQGTPFPVSSLKSIFYPADAGQNYAGVTDDSLGAAWDKANAELDASTRIKDAQAIDKKIVAVAGTIPLFAEPYAWGVRKDLVNYGPAQFQSSSVKWQDVGYTK